MTTLLELAQERLREQRDGQRAQEVEAEALRVRLAQERAEVLRLVERDVLQGAELPAGADISARSSTYGHSVWIDFPGKSYIISDYLYTVVDGELFTRGRMSCQRWLARQRPAGKQRTFDDFIAAVIYVLDIKLDETPPIVTERPAMSALLHAAERLCVDLGVMESSTTPLWAILDRYRCTCGEFPVEGHVRCWWMVRCCGHEWESWDEFVAWREEQDAKAGA